MCDSGDKNDMAPSKSEVLDSMEDLAVDFGEGWIDDVANSEIVRNVPVLKSITTLISAGKYVNEMLFTRKIWGFVHNNEFTCDELNGLIEKIDKSEKYRIKTGEAILNRINRAQDFEVAEILAKVVKARVRGYLSIEWFTRISDMVANASSSDIKDLIDEYKKNYQNRGVIGGSSTASIGSGFYYISYDSPVQTSSLGGVAITGKPGGINIYMRREAQLLCRIILDEEIDEVNWGMFR